MIDTRTCDRKLIRRDWKENLTSFRDKREIKVKRVKSGKEFLSSRKETHDDKRASLQDRFFDLLTRNVILGREKLATRAPSENLVHSTNKDSKVHSLYYCLTK